MRHLLMAMFLMFRSLSADHTVAQTQQNVGLGFSHTKEGNNVAKRGAKESIIN